MDNDAIRDHLEGEELRLRTSFNHIIYGDDWIKSSDKPWVPPTLWRRIRARGINYCERVRDAWLVLRGKAWIDD